MPSPYVSRELVEDVRRGTIISDLLIPTANRQALEKRLKPLPNRASELKREFEKGFEGLIIVGALT